MAIFKTEKTLYRYGELYKFGEFMSLALTYLNNPYTINYLPNQVLFPHTFLMPAIYPSLNTTTNIFSFLFKKNTINPTVNFKPIELNFSTKNSNDAAREIKSKYSVKPAKVKAELGPEFLKRVKQIAKNLNCNYKDLLAVMNAESGLNSKAVNPNGGATGLIQFMPSTATELGTTTEALKNMSPTEQLDYVEKYYLKNKKIAGYNTNEKLDAGDLYALTFLPARAKRETLTVNTESYYRWNKGLDINGDGKISKTELAQRVASRRVNESIFA